MSRYRGHRVNSDVVGEAGKKGRRIAKKAPVAVVAVMSCCCLVVGGSAMTLGSQAPEDDSLLASVVAVAEGNNESASLAVEKDIIVLQPEKEEKEAEVVVPDIVEEEEEEPVPVEVEAFEPVSVIQEIPDEEPEPVIEEPVDEEPVQEDVIEEPEEEAEEPVEEEIEEPEPVEEEIEEPEPVEEEVAEPEPVVEETPAEPEEPAEESYETAVLGVAISTDEVEYEEPEETAPPEATPSTEESSSTTSTSGIDFPATGVVNATAGLNLRSGSSTSTSVKCCIPYNTYLTLTGEENGWYKTSYMGYEGYVSGQYITITNGDASSSSNSNSGTTATPSTNNGALNFIWPVYGGTISSNFGMRSGSMHYGTDIYSRLGTNIHASESGTVSYTGTMGTYGLLVIIDHANGYQTYYAHCSQILCSVGQYVNQGDVIALVGQTGNATGPHCHFEIRINGTAYNPLNWVSPS